MTETGATTTEIALTDLLAAKDATGAKSPREASAGSRRSAGGGAARAEPQTSPCAASPAWPTAETEAAETGEVETEAAEIEEVKTVETENKEVETEEAGTPLQAKTSQVENLNLLCLEWVKAAQTSDTKLLFSPCSLIVERESVPAPPGLSKPAMTEEEVEKKSTAIIEEFLHINDVKVHVENQSACKVVFIKTIWVLTYLIYSLAL